jgi:hypothetical protein
VKQNSRCCPSILIGRHSEDIFLFQQSFCLFCQPPLKGPEAQFEEIRLSLQDNVAGLASFSTKYFFVIDQAGRCVGCILG